MRKNIEQVEVEKKKRESILEVNKPLFIRGGEEIAPPEEDFALLV